MPICPDNTDISISYYFFNKTDDRNIAVLYCQEILYAYRQLITHTNILECGRVRFFVDKRWKDVAQEQFSQCGLESLISLIDVNEGVHLAGYIPHLDHPDIHECQYRFHSDADLFWMSNDDDKFNWKAFCDTLEKTDDKCIYAQPIEKTKWVLQTNYAQFAPDEERKDQAANNIRKIFGLNIPDDFKDMTTIDYEELVDSNEISELRCVGGWFVGVRKDSKALKTIQELYEATSDILTDDEGFFAILFHLNPDIEINKVIQGTGDPKPHEIKHAALDNHKGMRGAGVINVGTQPFYDPHLDAERKELAAYFTNQMHDEESNVSLKVNPNPLQFFGEHIFGTLALDCAGNMFPLTASVDYQCPGAFLSFPAAFAPWQELLPYKIHEKPLIDIIYCLSYHPNYFSHDTHVYAKSMIYAYKTLVQNTNILECGNVYFYVDNRVLDIALPYFRAAGELYPQRNGIEDLIIPFESDKKVHYAAYVPFLCEETEAKYRLYFDLDMWWVNLYDSTFNWKSLVDKLDKLPDGLLGCEVPKNSDSYHADIFNRCRYEGDVHLDGFDESVLPKSDFRAITGSQNGVNAQGDTVKQIKSFYEDFGDVIRDDEAFWTTFLTLNPDVNINPLHHHIKGCGFNKEGMEGYKKGTALSHVGTYLLYHFFNHPYATVFYNHFKEKIL